MKEEAERIATGEVWGIRNTHKDGAPWFDICVILGQLGPNGNCHALSITSGRYVTDFSHGEMPRKDDMSGWERIL